jgi:protein-tyrosine phosphatase
VPVILFVCTGNLCRSPLMEYLLRDELARRGVGPDVLEIRSAGTHARDDEPMHRHSLAVLADRQLDGSGFSTDWLTDSVLADVDVVIGASREHRAAAAGLRPALLNRSFTLAEISRIAATVDRSELPDGGVVERLTALVPLAASRRTQTLPEDPTADDLFDPLGGPLEDFVACAATIDRLLAPVIRLLVP